MFSKEEAPSERYLKGEPKQDCQRWEDGWGKPKVREDTSNPNRYKGHVIDLVEVHAPQPASPTFSNESMQGKLTDV